MVVLIGFLMVSGSSMLLGHKDVKSGKTGSYIFKY